METHTHKNKKRKRRRYHRPPPGTSPGMLVVDPEAPPPAICAIGYGPEALQEQEVDDPRLIGDFLKKFPVTWVNVNGLGDAVVIKALAEVFGLHRLALEDVINLGQRAKVEQFSDHLFIVGRMVTLGDNLETEQLSLFLGERFVLTFHEHTEDCFGRVRERIRNKIGRIRGAGPDYLAYALLDSVVDGYFPVLEKYSERMDILEDEVIAQPGSDSISQIHNLKRDLLTLRRAVWPKREAINSLLRESMPFITDETRIHLRDCYDHVIQIIDLLENYREIASGLMDAYLSGVSNRQNEVMKVLTIMASIFIPLTFMAGVYGMNFEHMPELHSIWAYPALLLVMLVTAVAMIIYFRRRGWFGQKKPEGSGTKT